MVWQYKHIPVVVTEMTQPTDSLLGLPPAQTPWQLHQQKRVPRPAMRCTKAAAACQLTYPEHLHTIETCDVRNMGRVVGQQLVMLLWQLRLTEHAQAAGEAV